MNSNFSKSKHQVSYLINETENQKINDLIESQKGIVSIY